MEPPPSLAGVNSVRPCTLFNDEIFSRNTCYCVEPPPSVAVLKSFCRKSFENRRGSRCPLPPALLKIDDTDARSVQKTPAGVLGVRRGLFFVKRQRRYPHICKSLDPPVIRLRIQSL